MSGYIKKEDEIILVRGILFVTVVGITASYYFYNSDISAILCFVFGFITVRYMTDSKFAEKMDEYF